MSIASNTQYGIAILIDPPFAKKLSGIDPSNYIEGLRIKLSEASNVLINAAGAQSYFTENRDTDKTFTIRIYIFLIRFII